jgi:TDG/mug DNA glycosylase family protein
MDDATNAVVETSAPAWDDQRVPMALHALHRSLEVGAIAELIDTGRRFSSWPAERLTDVIEGAGFSIHERATARRRDAEVDVEAEAQHDLLLLTRQRTLADTVGPGMRLLVCGLNPSLYAADAGAGFARPGNRFWPAAIEAGLVRRANDPVHALTAHGVGMTDLVKRASPRADDLSREEYHHGLDRIDRLAGWLQPRAICFVGLAGWRAAVDRKATTGIQERRLGGRPVYVMPNTSGVNASSSLADLTDHLRAALALAAA